MPNWISNEVKFTGKKEQVKALMELVKSEEREFDFNKIAPIPNELEGTQAPTKIISQKEYEEQEERLAKGELTENEKNWGISRGLTSELSKEYQKRFGADNWYDWQTTNWGTKWNAGDVSVSDDNSVFFNTAWSTPCAIFEKLSLLFPEVVISVRFADEDFGHNVGEFSLLNGYEISSNIPDGGTEKAYRMAYDIQGSEYYTWDMLFDVDDNEDVDDTYYSTMISISYEENKAVDEDFPVNVLNKFLELALADENFELAAEIKNILTQKEESGEEV